MMHPILHLVQYLAGIQATALALEEEVRCKRTRIRVRFFHRFKRAAGFPHENCHPPSRQQMMWGLHEIKWLS